MIEILTEYEADWFPGQTWQDRERATREHFAAEGIDVDDPNDTIGLDVSGITDEDELNAIEAKFFGVPLEEWLAPVEKRPHTVYRNGKYVGIEVF